MILLLDVSNLVHRAFHALPPLTAPDGTPTNAVFGFGKILNGIRERYSGAQVLAALDGGSDRRRRLYPAYKATRKKQPEELTRQFPLVTELLEAYGIPAFHVPGEEADDVLATLADLLREAGEEVVIVSGDKDLLQLVTDTGSVTVLDPSTWTRYFSETVRMKLGVLPGQIAWYLALVGDASDNYPGCPGVGPKRALELLARYQTLGGVLDAAAAGQIPGVVGKRLDEHADLVRLCMKLALPFYPPAVREAFHTCSAMTPFDPQRLNALCDRLGIVELKVEDWGAP